MADEKDNERDPARSRDEVALELMKFIAVTTGYGKGPSGERGSPPKAPAARRNTPTL